MTQTMQTIRELIRQAASHGLSVRAQDWIANHTNGEEMLQKTIAERRDNSSRETELTFWQVVA